MVVYVNPMTGQQITMPNGQEPNGCWCPIGNAEDIIVPTNVNNNDINMSVGNDFTDEDDEF